MPATDKVWRNLKTVHIVFALSSAGLFAVTIWMMAVDHLDEWRGYQSTFEDIEIAKIEEGQRGLRTADYVVAEANLKSLEEKANAQLRGKESELRILREQVTAAELAFEIAERAVKDQRAVRDVARANYDLGIRDNLPATQLDALKVSFDAEQQKVDERELELQQRKSERDTRQSLLAEQTAARDKIVADLVALRKNMDTMHAALVKLEPENWFSFRKRQVMEWPIIDGFNSPHKVIQDWLPDLKITLGMAKTARFDRCRTCHLGISRTEAGNKPSFPLGHPKSNSVKDWIAENKFPHPFATHPRPELYLTAASPHPVNEFGCTICHDGQGSGTSFSNASHTANDPHEYEVWHDEHGYKSNHFWGYPMLPKRFQESSCLKCHHSVVELGVNSTYGISAPKLFKGYQLIKKYGCFGCHEIQGFDSGSPIGPDLRLEPQTTEEAEKIAADPSLVAGKMRKVGPSLQHIASKTTKGFVEFWTENPSRFQPTTRMPRFFDLTNQIDAHAKSFEPVELAGIAQYLFDKSKPVDFLPMEKNYLPNVEKGQQAFSQKGCLACHSHRAFPNAKADFGPNLSRVYAKIQPPEEGQELKNSDGFKWLYTWIRDPERHHPRTKMPNLHLDPYNDGDTRIDPAADIAAFILHPNSEDATELQDAGFGIHNSIEADDATLDQMVELFLSGKVLSGSQFGQFMTSRKFPIPVDQIKGDEIELAQAPENGEVSDQQWRRMKLNYVGRRTISRYGCYGCHDISGFKTARSIGTTLQDWGRKDTSKLAVEHIYEWLQHHGEPDGSSTAERAERAAKAMAAGGTAAGEFDDEEHVAREIGAAFFLESLNHHGRPGFIWQKLRQPRSYDYKKIETKRYDERLRMPKFPLNEGEIEAIATFVLGLIAEPPAEQYLYQPTGAAFARVEGDRLIEKYNCGGCHILELPEVRYGVNLDQISATQLSPAEYPEGVELLRKLKPPRQAETGEVGEFEDAGKLPVISFRGLVFGRPDPLDDPEEQEFTYDLWETLKVGEKELLPGSRMLVGKLRLAGGEGHPDGYSVPPRGGAFAEWLVESLMKSTTDGNRALAWQMAPPPLYKEGVKVQTPWLYQFLRDPVKLRHTTVLRMPKFNMSSDEAQALANYFAAVDDAPFPYQQVIQRDSSAIAEYVLSLKPKLQQAVPASNNEYLSQSWKMLNAPLCIKCHSLGGRTVKISDPKKDIRGPNLEFVADRLRPEWTMLWLYKPQWITPFTSMPLPLPRNQKQFSEIFDGNADMQTIGIRDALMNYHRLLETEGETVFNPKAAPPVTGSGGE